MDNENILTCIEMFPNFDPEIISIVVQEKVSLEEMINTLLELNNELPQIDLNQLAAQDAQVRENIPQNTEG